jgi:hypothetical protein
MSSQQERPADTAGKAVPVLHLDPGFLADRADSALRIAQIIRESGDSDRPTPAASTTKWLHVSHLRLFSRRSPRQSPPPTSKTLMITEGIGERQAATSRSLIAAPFSVPTSTPCESARLRIRNTVETAVKKIASH